jgi:hypothetical protein
LSSAAFCLARRRSASCEPFVELGAGHQKVMLEKNRMQVFHEILGFLDESGAAALKESGLHPVRP